MSKGVDLGAAKYVIDNIMNLSRLLMKNVDQLLRNALGHKMSINCQKGWINSLIQDS